MVTQLLRIHGLHSLDASDVRTRINLLYSPERGE